MHYSFLGAIFGIVALGIVTLMGLTIFYGEDLVMQAENWELAQVLVPSIVSVLGWLVTIWWALRQVEIASDRNRKLQYEMLQSNEKIKALDAVIVAFIELNLSLHQIRRGAETLKINIEFEEQSKSNPDLPNIFEQTSDAYSKLFEEIETLKFMLSRLSTHGVNTDGCFSLLEELFAKFSGEESDWAIFQEDGAAYLMEQTQGYDELFDSIETLMKNCNRLCKKALNEVSKLV